jgi:GTP-binding protein
VAANKIDAIDDPERVVALQERAGALGLPFFRISAVTGEGVPRLLEAAWPHIATARVDQAAAVAADDEIERR